MINHFEVFATGPQRDGFDWVDHWLESDYGWDDAITGAAQLAVSPYFWITSQPELVDITEVETFRPTSPLFTQTKIWKFFNFNDQLNWSTLRLVKSGISSTFVPHEEIYVRGLPYIETDRNLVYFANGGEQSAKVNWKRLLTVFPRAQMVRGFDNRWEMFQYCADVSEGKDFFVVTGKSHIQDSSVFFRRFDPLAKHHWIFLASNPTTGLVYGHMGVVRYNTALVKQTPKNFGLDFTMAAPTHETKYIVSESCYSYTPYEAWRTAFREAVKLTLNLDFDPNAESRLNVWLKEGFGTNGIWSMQGAKDGHEWAAEHFYDMDTLVKSESWKWLEELWHKYGYDKNGENYAKVHQHSN